MKEAPSVSEEENGASPEAEGGTIVDPRRLHEAARIAEALVFASSSPVPEAYIADRLPGGVDVLHVMRELKALYAGRGVNLVAVDDAWAFRTAPDLSFVIRTDETEVRKLSRAALEVLSIIAYHQPVTRAEIEDIRGVQTSKGTLDVLMEAGWVRFRGRRRSPGRPVTFGTTRDFLDHFGLEELRDLPGLEELKGAGLLSGRIPSNFQVPLPLGEDEMAEDEDPITQLDLEELGLLAPGEE
ncbi:SMC-Scp complex subunit ScpB [Shinella sp.]|uniref:SMC-Scp complex subunit ScpB n=1 Tax=Shinella sp. TaxID=1870904 RepID=UPI0039E479F6